MKTIEILWKDLTVDKQVDIMRETGNSFNDYDLIATIDIEEE